MTGSRTGSTSRVRLLYRSNLLGSDKRITNYGGGNTSAKVTMPDPLTGEAVTVLWVKGSGGDVGTMKRDGFATLYQDRLEQLRGIYRGEAQEDEMVGYLPHCTFDLNPRAASIDTPLHAYLPYAHVDHMHPDAVIAIAATRNSREITRAVYGEEIGWLPWRRPGFQLGLDLSRFAAENPQAKGVVLESHGLFTWGDTAKDCYETTLRIINKAIAWFEAEIEGRTIFGGRAVEALEPARRRAVAAKLMPAIRGLIGTDETKVGHFDDGEAVLEFVGSKDLRPLAALGTSCPDHFLRTKIRPMVLDFDPAASDVDAVIAVLPAAVEAYRADYAAYYERCRHADSPAMRDPNAVVYLVPGVGMITFARDKATARIAGEFYVNAINVMRGASTVGTYQGLSEQEAFDIEYWLLEEAKLQRMPKPKALAGRVALVTGGAGGIGRAIAAKMLSDGACVVLADIDREALSVARDAFAKAFGKDQVRAVPIDVTNETGVRDGFAEACAELGGLDILVSNAGIASSAPIEATDTLHVEPQHGHPLDRLLSGRPGGLPAVQGAEARRFDRLRRLEERPRRLAERRRLLHRQGRRDSSRPLPRPGRRTGRHPRQRRQSRRRPARLEDLVRRMARAARGVLEDHDRRVGGTLPQPLAAEALSLSRGHRRGSHLPRLRPRLEVDRQHPQRRCRQRAELYAVARAATLLPRARQRGRGVEASLLLPLAGEGAVRRTRASRGRRDDMTNLPIDPDVIEASNTERRAAHDADYGALGEKLARSGVDIDAITEAVAAFHVAIPSWGVGTGGTRFARFPGPGEPRDIFDKLDDCAVIQQLCRATPSVSLHIPWDKADPSELKAKAGSLGLTFDAMNSNTFQDHPSDPRQPLSYKFGSLSHTDRAVREQAIAHNLETIEIGRAIGSTALTVWVGDGSNFPGQADLGRAFERYLDSMKEVAAALPDGWRVFTEHKMYEPAFYSTVVQDWGTNLMIAQELGENAFCLVDLGHHALSVNIEQIVSRLIHSGKLGGFHFNDSRYGDDDLDAGSIDPFRLFLVFNELVGAGERLEALHPAHMIDQSHNVTDPIESLIRSAGEIRRAYAQALLVDRQALAGHQDENDALMASETLKKAFRTDVEPILERARSAAGGAIDPVAAYRASGYRGKVAGERPASKGAGGGIV